MGYPTKWGFSAGSSRWGLSQRRTSFVCEVKIGVTMICPFCVSSKRGTPRSGALGGSRECNSLPQTATCCRAELK
ncbi:hypothetical protein [Campylobacter devanensis]|uniref:hypothetical protein n=1 Tax=Campylobacter devanensis TaxID=3161138 RepID=UPI00191C72BB|nr:hypothetical protein [Campylobacter sp. P148]